MIPVLIESDSSNVKDIKEKLIFLKTELSLKQREYRSLLKTLAVLEKSDALKMFSLNLEKCETLGEREILLDEVGVKVGLNIDKEFQEIDTLANKDIHVNSYADICRKEVITNEDTPIYVVNKPNRTIFSKVIKSQISTDIDNLIAPSLWVSGFPTEMTREGIYNLFKTEDCKLREDMISFKGHYAFVNYENQGAAESANSKEWKYEGSVLETNIRYPRNKAY
jgi:hypothetical protein